MQDRRIFRVTGAYILVAWILMQAGEIVFPAFDLPNSALRALILALVAILPVVIVLAWILDVTPSGIRLTRRSAESEDEAASDPEMAAESAGGLGRSLEMLLLGVCIPVFAAASIFLYMTLRGLGVESVVGPPLPTHAGQPSLAVLPFEDLSVGAEDEGFFARGMHEDVLTQLARLDRLKLISRTSVMAYAESPQNVRVIARELGVNHVLEGTVRRTDTHVRVSAQLIRADTDEHLWAENFDAELENVFEVQSRIARAIADALATEFAPRAPGGAPARSADIVPAAYDAYLKARDRHRNLDAENPMELERARHLYEMAVQLDPSLAAAWRHLGVLHAEAHWFGFDRSPERTRLARESLDRARAEGLDEGELALADGILAYYVDAELGKALLLFQHARELSPGSSEALFYEAMVLRRRGQLEQALAAQRVSLELDPRNLAFRDELALTLSLAGRLEEARDALVAILAEEPNRTRAQVQRWQLELELDGRPDELLDEILSLPPERFRDQHEAMLDTVAILAGRPELAVQRLEGRVATEAGSGFRDYQLAVLTRRAGDVERSARLLERASGRVRRQLDQARDAIPETDRRRIESLLALESGDVDRAIALRSANVEALPIERDLIAGAAPLWLLVEAQLVAGRVEDALESLERLRSHVALGGLLHGGYFVLAHWPDFEASRREPRFQRALDAMRPAYAERWPTGSPRTARAEGTPGGEPR